MPASNASPSRAPFRPQNRNPATVKAVRGCGNSESSAAPVVLFRSDHGFKHRSKDAVMPTDPFTAARLERGALHLHKLGARATAELLAEVGNRIGGMTTILAVLGEYQS